jgi:UTP--glucose-1-phosphate uridylyltransferase
LIVEQLDAGTREILERYGFDPDEFERLRARVADGSLSSAGNVVAGTVEPPAAEDLTSLPEPGTSAWEEARAAGQEALRRGEVAQVILNGGMATRFGGVVKGIVEVLDGKSFLDLKLEQTERLARGLDAPVHTAVMTSFATDEPTRTFVASRGGSEPLVFSQFVSLRLEPDGSLFRSADGRPSLYGPGHGDVLEAIRSSGALAALVGRGVRHVQISNVDNLGARIDPVVLGAHVLAGRPFTAESAPKDRDMGGAPARVNGRPMLLETYRFPPEFDQSSIPVFNTNTAWFTIDALERPYRLTWLFVEKRVAGRTAVQLERLYHEVSAFLPTTYLVVPRTGPRGRFVPIKTPADLEASQGVLRELLGRQLLD